MQVSVSAGREPVWTRGGKRLFNCEGRHTVGASVSAAGGFAVTGHTEVLHDTYVFSKAAHANYDVSPDGTRLLMVGNAQNPEYVVVYGWQSELAARMCAAGGK